MHLKIVVHLIHLNYYQNNDNNYIPYKNKSYQDYMMQQHRGDRGGFPDNEIEEQNRSFKPKSFNNNKNNYYNNLSSNEYNSSNYQMKGSDNFKNSKFLINQEDYIEKTNTANYYYGNSRQDKRELQNEIPNQSPYNNIDTGNQLGSFQMGRYFIIKSIDEENIHKVNNQII